MPEIAEVCVNHIYKHFKGNAYVVHAVGTHTETKERYVVYQEWQSHPVGKVWIRPLEMFTGLTPNGKPRFERIGYSKPLPEDPDWR